MTFITWLAPLRPRTRARARLREPVQRADTVDELALDVIRDAIADQLTPGTSTLKPGDLLDPRAVLRAARFWPQARWIPRGKADAEATPEEVIEYNRVRIDVAPLRVDLDEALADAPVRMSVLIFRDEPVLGRTDVAPPTDDPVRGLVRVALPGHPIPGLPGSGGRASLATRMNRICVFCGSSPGARPAYQDAARQLGELLARRGLGLVYGGGNVGLMGVVADAALAAGGEVDGVIPDHLQQRELGHEGVSRLHIVGSMHERKALMADLADGFIALPGGIGTLEELAEIFTWSQLGLHEKPLGLLDVDGYYRRLVGFLDHAVDEEFLHPEHRALLLSDDEPEPLLDALSAWRPVPVDKWLDRDTR